MYDVGGTGDNTCGAVVIADSIGPVVHGSACGAFGLGSEDLLPIVD